MPRYKLIDTNPQFLAVDLAKQLLPGSFEHAVHHLVTHELDLSAFDARIQNDATGATAYPPAMLLEVVLCAYAHGIVSSRAIAQACEDHITFIALCGARAPHFTTIAHFVSTLSEPIATVFAGVLTVCDRQGLIGRTMFAIDGVKLSSNASKHRSGTRAEFAAQATKLEAAAKTMLARHRAEDAVPQEPALVAKEAARVATLKRDAADLRTWLVAYPADRRGPTGGLRKSNRTDNESAKMATANGVLQGYTGVAAVDAAHQIVVAAEAFGTGAEQECLLPMVTATDMVRGQDTLITADAGYHSEANLCVLAANCIDALIADGQVRARDDRFATQGRHRAAPDPLHDKSAASDTPRVFQPTDFQFDAAARTCVCPAGKSLYRKGAQLATKGYIADRFQGAKRDCGPCPLRAQCLRTPEKTKVRQVAFFTGRTAAKRDTQTARMQRRIDEPANRVRYAQRFAVVEPVFANLRYNKGLDRFTLRGRTKVDGQWKLFCLVQNIEKLAHHGYAA
ncbi:MAG: IS1182 family transposase [Gemmatimonadaceae bacterium]